MKLTNIKAILITGFLFCFLPFADASQTSYLKQMTRSDMEASFLLNDGSASIILQDPLYNEPLGDPQSQEYQRTRNVLVHLIYGREDLSDVAGNFFKYKIEYRITFLNKQTQSLPETGILEIEFNESSGVYEAVGKHLDIPATFFAAKLEILSICGDHTGDGSYTEQCLGGGVTDLGINADDIRLELEMQVEKIYKLDYVLEIPQIHHEANYVENVISEVNIAWSFLPGFEEYELEYVYWDVRANDQPNNTNDPNYEELLFENSIRVTTWKNDFKLDGTYPEGELSFRVRGVGRFIHNVGTDYSIKKYGRWSDIRTQVISDVDNLQPFEEGKNWQFTRTFAEEGKNKTVLSYHDGSLRNRQLLTNLSDAEVTLVAESDYSIEGQGVMSILPAPAPKSDNNFFFKTGFNQNLNGEAYSYRDFDKMDGASELNTLSGAGKYFSPNNDFDDIHKNYIANAFQFPLTQSKYLRDATGRMSAQGGVGEFYQLGTGRETRYYYLNAKSTELRRLFGSNVGNAQHYKKNLVVDPNGQISVSYVDQGGQVIATALMGDHPENVVDLDNSDEVVTVNNLMESNQKDLLLSRSVNALFNAKDPTNYDFTYQLNGVYNQLGDYCETCEYELSIRILDEDGNEIFLRENQYPVGGVDDHDCSQGGTYAVEPETFTVELTAIGEYQVIKELSVIGGGLDIANLQEYLQFSDLLPDFNQYLDEAMANIDYSQCEWSCFDFCKSNAETSNPSWFDANGDVIPMYQPDFDAYIETCIPDECEAAITEDITSGVAEGECESALEQMKTQLSPGGYSYPPSTNRFAYQTQSLDILRTLLEDVPFYIYDLNGYVYTLENGVITDPNGVIVSMVVIDDGSVDGLQITDFLDFFQNALSREEAWQEQWAESLVKFHREHCLYIECLDLNTAEEGVRSNYEWDLYLTSAETPPGDLANAPWGDPLLNILFLTDPFYFIQFTDQGFCSSNDLYTKMADKLNANTPPSIFDDIDALILEQQSNPDAPLFNATLEEEAEFRWQLFRGAYINAKREVIKECGCYNSISIVDEYRIFVHPEISDLADINDATNWGNGQVGTFCNDLCEGQVDQWIQQINNYLSDNCSPAILSSGDETLIRQELQDYCTNTCGSGTTPIVEMNGTAIAGDPDLQQVQVLLNPYTCPDNVLEELIPEVSVYDNWQIIDPCIYTILDAVNEHLLPICGSSGSSTYVATTEEETDCFSFVKISNGQNISVGTTLFDCPNELLQLYFVLGGGFEVDFLCGDNVQIVNVHVAEAPITLPTGLLEDYTGLSADLLYPDGTIKEGLYLMHRFSATCQDHSPFTIDLEEMQEDCEDALEEAATAEAIEAWQEASDLVISTYYNSLNNCILNAEETFFVSFNNAEYHHTLYYYDQAGNLIQTVPPIGVDVLDGTAFTNNGVEDGVWNGQEPTHTQQTVYKYNSLDQVREQNSPDGGTNRFKYDYAQRLRFSQNDKQLEDDNDQGKIYSYTKYDAESRIVEVGQIENAVTAFSVLGDGQVNDLDYPESTDGTLEDVVTTEYSVPGTIDNSFAQENLKGRVAYTSGEYSNTRYSYDAHGNVKSLQRSLNVIGKKRIDYDYDLISGNVKEVVLQEGERDQFYHRYEYDADNRLTHVYTSEDGCLWENDARYFYSIHGPMARVEIGEDKIQGMDYYYSLQGWVKGVNLPGADSWAYEMGADGNPTTNLNRLVGRDEYAYALGYHEKDYNPIGGPAINLGMAGLSVWDDIDGHVKDKGDLTGLFNGNITMMVTDLKALHDTGLEGLQAMSYQYDQLHRIKDARSYGSDGLIWTENNRYNSNYNYDGNGNLQHLHRNGPTDQNPTSQMDLMFYHYDDPVRPNQLSYVTDFVPAHIYENDFDNQPVNNYGYDAIGNLTRDDAEYIEDIWWNVYGKVDAVIYSEEGMNLGRKVVGYRYDEAGNRIEKGIADTNRTFYLRDASGNIMAVYESDFSTNDLSQKEVSLYGSSRIGQRKFSNRVLNGVYTPPPPIQRIRGERAYELSNHLGNVLVSISDQKMGEDSDNDYIAEYYDAIERNVSDYYPFGFQMGDRTVQSGDYRYGFNGKEKDENGEWGSQTHYDYGFRIYNPSIGKFLSVDPLSPQYPWYTPYQFAGNKPIAAIDLDGLEEIHYKVVIDREQGTATIEYTHTEDLIESVYAGLVHNGVGYTPSFKEVVNARKAVVFDIYDPGYGHNREGRTKTYSGKVKDLTDKEFPDAASTGSGYAEAYSFDVYDLGAAMEGKEELSDSEKDEIDLEFGLTLFSFIPVSRVITMPSNWIKVGRWMSKKELELMKSTGKVQMGAGDQTSVIIGGAKNKESFKAAAKGSKFVEFEIPASTHIGQGGKAVWGTLFGPKSSIGKILKKRGVELTPPKVRNIEVVDTK